MAITVKIANGNDPWPGGCKSRTEVTSATASINTTGKVIDSQNEVGGWDMYPSVSRPAGFDTDRDGMPDAWERELGLNPNDPTDGNQNHNGDGFTNLEQYINGLTQS